MSGGRPLQRKTLADRVEEVLTRVEQVERRYDPDLQDVFVDESCMPPPGSLVRPPFHQRSGYPPNVGVGRFPGGVIVARMYEFTDANDDSAPIKRQGPSRNASRIMLFGTPNGNNVDNFDDAVEGWSFKPVDDLGCIPDMPYGIFYSYRCDGDGGVVHLEGRSNSALGSTDARLWVNGGLRHHNANTGSLEWGEPGTIDLAELAYYGLKPVGGDTLYGDWPMQGLGGPGLAFVAGETITVKPFADGGGGDGWFALDHIVLMPTFPLGVTDPDNLDDPEANFTSSALTAFGYYVASGQPASVTEPTDDGSWFGGTDTVHDDQVIQSHWDPAGHLTIAGHDESDAEGIFTGVGGVHVYVMCRGHFASLPFGPSYPRSGGHLTCFTGSAPLSDILTEEAGGWCWAYAGRMPLGHSPQGAFGIMQWLDDGENFPQSTPPDAVRSTFIAYLPQAPCDIDAVSIEDPEPFVPDDTAPPPPETPLELQVSWDTLQESDEIVAWRTANPAEAAAIDAYREGGAAPSPTTDEGDALTAQATAYLETGVVHDDLDDSWTAWLASASYAAWAAANPAEETLLLDYRAGTGDRPTLTTEFGQGLVSETAAWYSAAPPGPDPITPDPTWPPAGAIAALTSDFESPLDAVWNDYFSAGGSIDRSFPDPRGGGNNLLRIFTDAEAAGPNPASSSAALYVNNGEARAAQGLKTSYQGRIYLPPDWIATRGEFNWLMEWHISDDVPQNGTGTNARSCTLGVWTEFTPDGSANVNPQWAFQYLGGSYASPIESSRTIAPFSLGETKFEMEFGWSVNLDGYCNIFMDDVFVTRFSGPNLFRTLSGDIDEPAFGFYNYHLKWASPLIVYWDKIAVVPL